MSFTRDGVYLANGRTVSFAGVVAVIEYWFNENVSTKVLASQYQFIWPAKDAAAYDENREVEYKWSRLLSDSEKLNLKAFIQVAAKDEILSKLFPFTSLFTLCFSRCTGYPFDTVDIPNITAKQHGYCAMPNYSQYRSGNDVSVDGEQLFIVTRNNGEYLGEGNAAEALKIVRDYLPDNMDPAVKGTAKD